MITKFTNAYILKEANSPVFFGELAIEDNKIIFVGDKFVGKCDKIIDCKNNLLMAGFINTHAHSPMSLLKGLGENSTLQDWLFKHIIPKEKQMSQQQIYDGSVLAICEMLKNGITCFQDNYFYPEITAKACENTGIRAVVSLSQNYSHNKFLSYEELEQLYQKLINKSELVDYNFYFHSIYTCDEQQILNSINLAKKYNKLLVTHLSETLTEVGECAKVHNGMTPVMLLDSLGFFECKTLLAHCVFLEKEDYQILENKQVSVSHNPSSNLKLGSGVANLKALKQRNINICLGTDGSASNNRLDMFREMYLASTLQKALFHDASLISSEDALNMATMNGAKALDNDKIGCLKQGNFADIIMINLNSIENLIHNDVKSNLVFACGSEDVIMTMVNGKILYYGGKFSENITKQLNLISK